MSKLLRFVDILIKNNHSKFLQISMYQFFKYKKVDINSYIYIKEFNLYIRKISFRK